jgi:hypothetical protein
MIFGQAEFIRLKNITRPVKDAATNLQKIALKLRAISHYQIIRHNGLDSWS